MKQNEARQTKDLVSRIKIERKGVETFFAATGILANEIHKILRERQKIRAEINYDPEQSNISVDIFVLED